MSKKKKEIPKWAEPETNPEQQQEVTLIDGLWKLGNAIQQQAGAIDNLATSVVRLIDATVVNQPTKTTPQKPVKATKPTTKTTANIENIQEMFPEDLAELLAFEETDEHILVKPKTFLGSDNFSKIASIVRGINGEYISAGRESHFRIPKK